MSDGAGPTANDTATNTGNAYLAGDTLTGANPLTLNSTYTWTNDATRGTALTLDGITGYGAASNPIVNTVPGAQIYTPQSFTVSGWVNLTSLPTRNAAVATQNGTTNSGFYLGYNYARANKPAWDFYFATADTINPGFKDATTSTASTGWTHLVGVYNAATKTAQLYVNGALAATATGITEWQSTGAFTVGRDLYNGNPTDYFPGEISNLQAFNYALSAPQITALHDQIQ
ncbi:LamG domain-containing protein [Actinocrinis puniceicyclus]|uniref:LamG domain-containing protein n=1 Tax=Actinocrinis puniceicyclus TaxID=977794 RepID=A0A8J8BHD2_9ACTN|nr:LamG domain-containing protein [Actinocrinis puniceicyclus]MBS2966669.1 LamG domain-containing protein [Actinocrinis puniceicyclus]